MRKGTLVGVVAVSVGALALGSSVAAGVLSADSLRATPLPSSSCHAVQYTGSGSPRYLIATDFPLRGPGQPQTLEMGKAVNFILGQHKYRAGRFTVGYQTCDDSTAKAGRWDPARCASNAAAYVRNPAVLGVIGTFNSGCAATEIPVLNRAPGGPLGMVSPANEYVGLTRASPGTSRGEPNIYYPTGKRNFVRIIAAADFQPAAQALLAKQLKRAKVYVLQGEGPYGLAMSSSFRYAAQAIGLKVVGVSTWDPTASGYGPLATGIKKAGAQAVFLGGLFSDNGGQLIKDLHAGLGAKVELLAPSDFTPISTVVKGAGNAANGLAVSVAGLPNSELGAPGKKFLTQFKKVIGREPDPYAVYAAQATEILLDAIANSNGTRASVTANLFKTNITKGLLGSFRITKNGDTTSNPVTIYKVKGGKSTTFRVITPPNSLVKNA